MCYQYTPHYRSSPPGKFRALCPVYSCVLFVSWASGPANHPPLNSHFLHQSHVFQIKPCVLTVEQTELRNRSACAAGSEGKAELNDRGPLSLLGAYQTEIFRHTLTRHILKNRCSLSQKSCRDCQQGCCSCHEASEKIYETFLCLWNAQEDPV